MQVLLGEVTSVNPEGKQIVFNGMAYSYDHLILATQDQAALTSATKTGAPLRPR